MNSSLLLWLAFLFSSSLDNSYLLYSFLLCGGFVLSFSTCFHLILDYSCILFRCFSITKIFSPFLKQGLRWYAKRLRIDEDGDVADEFLEEVLTETSAATEEDNHTPSSKFEVKYSTRPAKVKNQVISPDGKIQQDVEYKGRFQWV